MDSVGYMNKAYFFAATLGVGFAASMVSKKAFKVNLGLPMTVGNAVKTSLVLAACAVGVDYAQEKDWIPKDPFSEKAVVPKTIIPTKPAKTG